MQKNQEFKDDLLEKLNIDVDILFNHDHPKFKTLYTEIDPNKWDLVESLRKDKSKRRLFGIGTYLTYHIVRKIMIWK